MLCEMGRDDFDDPLDDGRAELEARFQELEREAQLERLRRGQPASPPNAKGAPSPATAPDPLAAMKGALDDLEREPTMKAAGADSRAKDAAPGPPEEDSARRRFVVLVCPHCGAKNRTDLDRLRRQLPRCGGCKEVLASS
jgi:hypothetical protein